MVTIPLVVSGGEAVLEVTGQAAVVDGVERIPPGLFGTHHVPLDAERVASWGIGAVRLIHFDGGGPATPGKTPDLPSGVPVLVECQFDRFRPALMLTEPRTWEARLERLAAAYAARPPDGIATRAVEFWNAPWIAWVTRPGVNLDPRFYRRDDAVEDGPVSLVGESAPLPGLRWRRGAWYEPLSKPGDLMGNYGSVGIGFDAFLAAKPGEEFVAAFGRRFRKVEALIPADSDQESWFAGPANRAIYARMYGVFAAAARRADPELRLLLSWEAPPQLEGWLPWRTLIRPVLDEHAALVDGIAEHHHGGDPAAMAGVYETIAAYARHTHGRRLGFWCTEASADVSSCPTGGESPLTAWAKRRFADDPPLGEAWLAAAYLLRDLMALLDECPDKAVARCAHYSGDKGGYDAAFRLLRPLRGRILRCRRTDPGLMIAASFGDRGLAVVVINQTAAPRRVPVLVRAPAGCSLTGGGSARVVPDREHHQLVLDEQDLTAVGGFWREEIDLEPYEANRLCFVLEGTPRFDVIRVLRYPSAVILTKASPGAPAAMDVRLDPMLAAAVDAATLRVFGDWPPDAEISASVAGVEVPLKVGRWSARGAFDPRILKRNGEIPILIHSRKEPVPVWTASIELEIASPDRSGND